ncbi:MFS transporter [Luedemannella helvata]|uniref:MFS transporter n=1 Tax=Luedemannella helvata TaxID=349315 RepID=A0ABP4WT27_9ACTN
MQRDTDAPGGDDLAARGIARYAAVWRLPHAPTLLVYGTLGRLGLGITALALILHVAGVVGRYTPAAIAASCYALASAAVAPFVGRLADRLGPAPVLRVTAVAHPVALVLLLLAARGPRPSVVLIWVAAALAGATYPPLSAAVRGAWNALTSVISGRHHLRTTALAAEATLVELIFVLGPLLVALVVAIANPAVALGVAAAVTLVGTWFVAASPAMRRAAPAEPHERARGLGPLRVPGFAALVVCAGTLGVSFGASGVVVPAFAERHVGGADSDSVAAVLLAVWGLGSAIGGLWYGTRAPAVPLVKQLGWLLFAVAGSLAVLAVVPSAGLMAAVLIIGGAAIAPAMIITNTLVGRIVPATMHTEAYTWILTVSIAAGAMGGSVTGFLVDHTGVGWAFAFMSACVAAGAIVAGWPAGPIATADARATSRDVMAP